MTDFFIETNKDSVYPSSQDHFSPDTLYPEYIWGGSAISKKKNDVYEMVRNCLIGLEMDANNYNKRKWNPLGVLINEGDTVLIKPNWVMHLNKNKRITENGLECLITHPSVVRAITDYCLIALKGTGKLIIGDAPMQGCDLDNLIEKSGYDELFGFYKQRSINLLPTDFREYAVLVDENNVITGKRRNADEALEIDLGMNSKFTSNNSNNKSYKVSDYDEKLTNAFHSKERHAYAINKIVLSANVVINLPKPKCHRLAGMTGALKNFVGITYNKACLPHRTVGSKMQGGDEYLYNSSIKRIIGKVLDKKINFENSNRYTLALSMRYIYGLLYKYMKIASKDKFLIGSWYGNDTIWRTVLDLYLILLYADKNGNILDTKQRIIFNIADMIISGERNGPISPEPKKLGIIVAGYDTVVMDRLVCEIMGFDYLKLPTINNAVKDEFLIQKKITDYFIGSNMLDYNNKLIEELHFPEKWKFEPHDSWKGCIEK